LDHAEQLRLRERPSVVRVVDERRGMSAFEVAWFTVRILRLEVGLHGSELVEGPRNVVLLNHRVQFFDVSRRHLVIVGRNDGLIHRKADFNSLI